MYYPVPGHTHVKVWVPDTSTSHEDAPEPAPSRADLSPLVRVALDAAFGIRGIHALHERTFTRGVRMHVSARRRAGAPTGTVEVASCHSSGGGEFYGTAISAGQRYGWVARIERGRLVSFKVL